jgi:hypothetical protein
MANPGSRPSRTEPPTSRRGVFVERALRFALSIAIALTLGWSAAAAAVCDAAADRSAAIAMRTEAARAAGVPEALADAVGVAVTRLLEMEEPAAQGGWPYEGVYRVRREIPLGYRVGGTAIVATALLQAPGYAEDPPRQAAVERALRFTIDAIEAPPMSPQYGGGYDVRGWGYIYALRFLLRLEALEAVPPQQADSVAAALRFYIDALQRIEIPQSGGWNYARRGPLEQPGPAAPFMTAPAVRALHEAQAQGHAVDGAVLGRGIASLLACRGGDGTIVYSGARGVRIDPASRPGAIGRMVSAEPVLLLADRSSPQRVREAVEAFLAYWEELEVRRAKTGTHVAPYGVAPYYFMFGHAAAAEAIEALPAPWRRGLREAFLARLLSVRGDDGTWNDRVFPRSANYGTALALEALLAPLAPPPAPWSLAADADAAAAAPSTAPQDSGRSESTP